MQCPYFPHTQEDLKQMLYKAGAVSLRDLFADVPEEFIYKGEFNLPDAMSEMEVLETFRRMESLDKPLTVFCGAGAYDHYAPAVIRYILSRSEFQTAYTPYQAEISQGTLRYIFEFQSMICSLTGMDCANASMYDGPTSAAEAMMMCVAASRRRRRILVSAALLPQVLDVVRTYADYHGMDVGTVAQADGVTSADSLRELLSAGDVAGVLVPGINRYGIIEDLTGACRKEYMRKLPGRIVGATSDAQGRRAFVLTLQAREQHIRREKATSNICSNQSLMALYATVYLSLMGHEGLKRANDLSYAGAHYLHDRLIATGCFEDVFDKPFLKEFVLRSSVPADQLQRSLAEEGFFAALQTEEGYVSFCVTEKRSREEIDRLLAVIRTVI